MLMRIAATPYLISTPGSLPGPPLSSAFLPGLQVASPAELTSWTWTVRRSFLELGSNSLSTSTMPSGETCLSSEDVTRVFSCGRLMDPEHGRDLLKISFLTVPLEDMLRRATELGFLHPPKVRHPTSSLRTGKFSRWELNMSLSMIATEALSSHLAMVVLGLGGPLDGFSLMACVQ